MKTFAKRAVLAGLVTGMGLFTVGCERGTGGAGEQEEYRAPMDEAQPEPGTGGSYEEGEPGIHDDMGMGQDPAMDDPAMQDPAMNDPMMEDPAMQDPEMMPDDGTGGAGFPEEDPAQTPEINPEMDPQMDPQMDPEMNPEMNPEAQPQ